MSSTLSRRLRLLVVAVASCALLALALGAGSASAASAWWLLDSSTGPTNLVPGTKAIVSASAVNAGYTEASGVKKTIFITDTLPTGVKLVKIESSEAGVYAPFGGQIPIPLTCKVEGQAIRCPLEGVVFASEGIKLKLEVEVESTLVNGSTNDVKIEGGLDGKGEEIPGKSLAHPLIVSSEPNTFGLENYEIRPEDAEGNIETQAGAHPFQLTTTVDLNELSETTLFFGKTPKLNPVPPDLTKNLHFVLPRGLIGNVAHRPQCTEADFDTFFTGHVNNCRENTAIGVASVTLLEPTTLGLATAPVPVFNLVPAPGEPARFGFEFFEVPVVLTTKVRSGSDYAVEVSVHYASEAANIEGSQVTFWGVPGDKRHDPSRGWECLADGFQVAGLSTPRPCKPSEEAHPSAFLTMPTSCEGVPVSTASGEAWQEGVHFAGLPADEFSFTPFTNCGALPFKPTVEVESDTSSAATPSGMTVSVKVPQDTTLSGEEGSLAEATVRSTTLTLPQGVMASGGASNGLLTCTSGEFGFNDGPEALGPLTENDHFDTNDVHCPDASKVGTVNIVTPLLEHELTGSVYLAHINTNPFDSPLVLFISAEDKTSGVQVSLAGEVKPNLATGELTSVFRETPPVAFSELNLHLFNGARATQSTPETCGVHEGSAQFESWAMNHEAHESYSPPNPALNITSEPGGTPCVSSATSQPFSPGFSAGSENLQGGAFSPFVVNLERPDGQQALRSIQVHLPLGAAAMLASVTPCAMAQVHADACPASSLVGHSTAVAGLGTSTVTIPGEVFLTEAIGPGQPFGLLTVSNAEHIGVSAGAPQGVFNLGRIPVLSGISVDEHTAQATVTSEALPQLVKGVPSQIKQLKVVVDRPEFTFNPTSCANLKTTGTVTGYGPSGTVGVHAVEWPYTATNCGALPFKPTIAVNVESDVSRLDGTGMKIVVKSGKGQANIHLTKLVFPNTVPSRLTTIQKACPAQTFEANPANCPEGSVIGSAIAKTPVLKSPLTGPAYLVSHANESFPDAVFVLQGEGIKLILDGKTNIKNGVTSSTFESIPDAPVESFEVTLPRGPHSAFSGFGNLCEKPIEVPTTFGGQNGGLIENKTLVTVEKCAKTGVKGAKKESELAKLLKQCKKAKKHKVRVKCEATAHKRVKAMNTCKAKNKKSKKKLASCEAKARKTYVLKLK
jgi:hypothetical protein